MDGVLVDFTRAWKELSGEDIDGFEYERIHGPEKFWGIISAEGEDFWANMPWMPDGQDLWKHVRQYNPRILTAPSEDPTSVTGKLKWLAKNIPEVNPESYTTSLKRLGDERVILNKNKWLAVSHDKTLKNLAGEIKTRSRRGEDVSDMQKKLDALRKRFILIDDMQKNVIPWEKAGGVGILHTDTNSTIAKLHKILS
jgi:hypothetical protein